jgi:hypothetical protein
MTIQQENKQTIQQSNLLTSQEHAICKLVATSGVPHGQRASFLLALNENITQAQAAEQSGLTLGQVKYWLAKFKRERLGMFPDTLLNNLSQKTEEEKTLDIKEEPEIKTQNEDSVEDKITETKTKKEKKDKKKNRKTKKGKKNKKGKKGKIGKKGKKGKK